MKATFISSLFATAAAATLLSSLPAHAASFGTGGISFDEDTTVDFTFDQSQGEYMSYLAIFSDGKEVTRLFEETRPFDASSLQQNASSDVGDMSRWTYDNGVNDWRGTAEPGGVVANKTASFKFLKGVTYSLGLISDSRWFGQDVLRKVYSTSSENTEWTGSKQAKFFNNGDQLVTQDPAALQKILKGDTDVANADPLKAPVLIAFDDRGNENDLDYNDFRVLASIRKAPVVKDVPEPTAALALLGVGAVGALKLRRRQSA